MSFPAPTDERRVPSEVVVEAKRLLRPQPGGCACRGSPGLEALVRTMMRSPVRLSRLRFTPGSPEVVYLHKGGHDDVEPTEGERVDAMELRRRVLRTAAAASRR